VLRSSTLRRGPWPSRCVDSVALSSAQSCTAAHSRLASLHLGASRAAQLAAAPRPFAVPLREKRRAWFSSKMHVGPQPPRVTPSRSVASCAAPLRRSPWPSRCVHSVASGSTQSYTSAWFSPKLHGGPQPHRITPPRRVAPCAALRCVAALDVPLRAARRAQFSSKLHVCPQPPRVTLPRSVGCCAARRCVAALGRSAACRASRLVQLKAARRPTAASRHSTSERRV